MVLGVLDEVNQLNFGFDFWWQNGKSAFINSALRAAS
jgi:hypothetical protein